jgi:hypothetical protein
MEKVKKSNNSVSTETEFVWYISEDDCRYPDQVRFLLHQEGLRCTRNPYSADSDTAVAPRSNSDVTLHVILQTVSLVLISKFIARF